MAEDAEIMDPELARRLAFADSPHGWIDNKLKGATSWIRDQVKRRQPTSEVKDLPFASMPSPVELIPTMAIEGARTANRWLYGVKDPSMIRDEDLLGPLGGGAMVAPFASIPRGAIGMNALRRNIDDIPFDLPTGPTPQRGAESFAAPAIKREEGEIFDYTTHDQMPPGNPLNLPELKPYKGKRAVNERMADMTSSPAVSRQVNSAVDRGLKEHPDTVLNWYNMLPLRERFHDLYKGKDPDDAFLKFNQSVAAMSPQNPVPENMAQGSWLYSRLQQGKRIPDDPKDVAKAGFGNQPAMGTRLSVARKKFGQDGEAYDYRKSPKTEFFGRSLAGDDSVPVIDAHAMRTMAMATKDPRMLQNSIRYSDDGGKTYKTYSPREMLESGEITMKEALKQPTWWQSGARGAMYDPATVPFMRSAEKFGISPGQAQAAAWYGNAEKTGVKTQPFTAMEILEQKIKQNAHARSKSPEQMLKDVINGDDFLLADQVRSSLPAAGAEAAKASRELQAPQRKLDDLGYYSKLDEVLGSLRPTDTVTMDTLAKRGVKAAEIEARGLSPFIADGKGAKVSDLQGGAQSVQVRESRYAPMDDVDSRSLDEFGNTYDSITPDQQRQIDVMMGGRAPKGEPKWRDYATDGDNPSYHEGVLHLDPTQSEPYKALSEARQLLGNIPLGQPAREGVAGHAPGRTIQDQLDDITRQQEAMKADSFQSGHWDEPNAIAHYRASMQPTEGGGKAYLIDELQSDWGQKLRDGGVRDEAKIAELERRLAEAQAEMKALRPLAIEDAERIDQSGISRDLRMNWRAENDGVLAMGLKDWAADGVEIGGNAARFAELGDQVRLLSAERATAEAATPGNPFVNTSEQWMTTALRRMMRNAAEAQADGIAITPGAVHNERFGLSNVAENLRYNPDTGGLQYQPPGMGGSAWYSIRGADAITPEKLPDYIGKEMAEKLLQQPREGEYGGFHTISGVGNMEIGGEGMKYAYDKMLPKLLGKELSKLDPSIKYGQRKVAPSDWDGPLDAASFEGKPLSAQPFYENPFHHFPLTPKAREEIMKGLPLFNKADGSGAAVPFEAARAARELQSPLDMSQEARMQRAKEMGFDTENPLYVSATQPIDKFEPHGRFMGHKGISGISLSDNPEMASRYLDRFWSDMDWRGQEYRKNMMKVFIRPGETAEFDAPLRSSIPMGVPLPKNYKWPSALDNVDTAVFPDRITATGDDVQHLGKYSRKPMLKGNEYILRDPSRIRSVNADFDPAKIDSSDLMAANPGTEQILELMRAQQQLQQQAPFAEE